ncbi:MAG: exonuclease SbcCD subunit D [Siculibacillus sp.]|nr:exonuclease SbcCD subunit D [Siculibacillus sp.]
MIRILHTADWHLGQTLMGWSRDHEHEAALAALVEIAVAREIDALIVAGDVFDTQNPPPRAERLLYDTLVDLRRRIPHLTVVVTAGNHDPAGRLEAPRPVLAALGIHAVGTVARAAEGIDLDRHLVPLPDRHGRIEAHALVLPYLGPASLPPIDRRSEEPGSPVVRAVRTFHEAAIGAARARIGATPLVVTGHLAVGGGLESEGAERRILIGGEHAVPSDLFPADLAYVALGHLHRPQAIGRPTLRYSGSLFPLSASERDYDHGVSLVTIEGAEVAVEHLSLPRPLPFLRLPANGTMTRGEIEAAFAGLGLAPDLPVEVRPWVQLALRLEGPDPGLKAELDRAAEAFPVRLVGHTIEKPEIDPATHADAADTFVDLAERDPEELFRLAFARHHGVGPEPAHLGAFAEIREEV